MIPVFNKDKTKHYKLTMKDLKDHYNNSRYPHTSEQTRDIIFEYLKKCNLRFEEMVAITAALGNENFVNKLVLAKDISFTNCNLSFVDNRIHSVCYSYMNDRESKKLYQMYDKWAEEAEEIWIYIDSMNKKDSDDD